MTTIKLRRDTAANWLAADPVLALAEPGFETDTGKLKIGNGNDDWSTLPYVADTGNIGFEGDWIKNVDTGNIFISPQDGNTFLNLPSDTQAGTDPVRLGNVDSAGSVEIVAGRPQKTWTFDKSGTINTPLFFPKTFTALLLPVYGGGTDGPYGGNAWEIGVTFDADADGTVSTLVDNIFPILNNPGYKNGDSWTFHEADHGIPGYTFTLALGNVVYPGGAGWTANVLASEPPEYTPTVKSLGAIKLTSNGHSIVLGTDGYLTMESLY